MPYLHCPTCRLTTFAPVRGSSPELCPRCASELAAEPRRFLRSTPARDGGSLDVDAVRAALPGGDGYPAATEPGRDSDGLRHSASRAEEVLRAGGRPGAPRREPTGDGPGGAAA